mmetsp:Transcript_39141/g.126572  ORF Transcript_39141/g.126572 Transcript_39141/m.126572 type:complete len:304 (+) Transcript_39141:214-1125(+)
MIASAEALLIAATRRAAPRAAPDEPPSSGVTTRSGTTAMSWKSKMPKEARPKRVASSPFSDRSWITKAEEESARPPPKTTAAGPEAPSAVATAPKTKEVSANCAPPRRNASRPTDLSLSSSSSSPISKRKKTTPNSASLVVVATSDTTPSPVGPRRMPAKRNPRTGERLRRPMIGVTSAAVASSTIVPRSAGEGRRAPAPPATSAPPRWRCAPPSRSALPPSSQERWRQQRSGRRRRRSEPSPAPRRREMERAAAWWRMELPRTPARPAGPRAGRDSCTPSAAPPRAPHVHSPRCGRPPPPSR